MMEPDVVEFGSVPARRHRWRWVIAVAVVLAIGLVVARTVQPERTAARPTITATTPQAVLGTGYAYATGTGREERDLWFILHNRSPAKIELSHPAVSPTPGVTVVSIGFQAGVNPFVTPDSTWTMTVGETVNVVVRYRVDCAAVRLPYPYLGDMTVVWASGSQSSTAKLQPITPAGTGDTSC